MLGLHRLLRRWHARKGRLVVLPSVHSAQLDNRRDLYVYVPAAPAPGDTGYPVIYMQDGQNLFDPAVSFAGTWGVDEALSWASRRGLDAIVVGIPNMGDARIAEYDPFRGTGDRYLDFVTRTVKPIVDAQFPTLPDRRHTGIAGSSMGGLISLYAFFRYSESFGFAAALSPSLWFADGALLDLVARAPRVSGRLYLDVGMREGQQTVALGRRLRDLLLAKGYAAARDFRWVEDEVIPFSAGQNPDPFVIAVGASFGAYHAACFGLRNPHLVNRIIGLSGLYDITRLTGGYSDANVYACNPSDFMRHEHDAARLEAFRRQDIILAVGRDDPACGNNQEFSQTLWGKGIGNALRIWDGWSHDWPYWEKMIRLYIGGHD